MNLPILDPAPAEVPASLPDRLQRYSRYVALVAEQLAAMERRDVARLQAIEEEREEIERGWQEEDTPPPEEIRALLHSGLRQLEDQAGQEEEERELWTRIQSEAIVAAPALRPRPFRIGSYSAQGSAANTVDVRF
jgi:ATP-dependent exoDNAse (exonuclease V) beta subunit